MPLWQNISSFFFLIGLQHQVSAFSSVVARYPSETSIFTHLSTCSLNEILLPLFFCQFYLCHYIFSNSVYVYMIKQLVLRLYTYCFFLHIFTATLSWAMLSIIPLFFLHICFSVLQCAQNCLFLYLQTNLFRTFISFNVFCTYPFICLSSHTISHESSSYSISTDIFVLQSLVISLVTFSFSNNQKFLFISLYIFFSF